jgi:hypothetical protein
VVRRASSSRIVSIVYTDEIKAGAITRTIIKMADLIQGLDGPRTAQQELFYDLEDATAIINWSVIELTDLASQATDAGQSAFLRKMCMILSAEQEKLRRYAEEAKAGRIVRAKSE